MALEFPQIDPIALSIGPFDIRWYALAYLAGFIIGWRYALHLAQRLGGITKEQIDDFLPWAIVAVILGGRLGYVLFYNLEYYIQNPLIPIALQFVDITIQWPSLLALWQGGMSFHGGALGMIAVMILYARYHKLTLLRLTDIVCCVVTIGLFFGRLANFANGELFGRETDVAWGMIFPNSGEEARHPSQLYQALTEGLLLFLILFWMARQNFAKEKAGLISAAFLGFYAVFRFFIEFFRQPDAHLGLLGFGLSMGQWLCIPMMLFAICLVVFIYKKQSIKE